MPKSWDGKLVNPCTWYGVTCNSENSVTRVDLGNANLSGQLVPQLGLLLNLQYLELYSNDISGRIPIELGNLTSLLSLDLYLNNLSGIIPDTLGRLQKLRFLRLNHNTLSGTIPMSLTTMNSLKVLDLSNNHLTGVVPVNGFFHLFTSVSFQNNNLTIPPTPPPPPFSPPPSSTASAEEDPEVHLGHLKRFSLRELQVATDNFSKIHIVGRGGFGRVYKGRLADGSLVAVKRLKGERSQGGERQFQTELEMISMAIHRNLLRLLAFA